MLDDLNLVDTLLNKKCKTGSHKVSCNSRVVEISEKTSDETCRKRLFSECRLFEFTPQKIKKHKEK